MSTRSVVAIPIGDGWKGRYIHYDGYPSGVGLHLMTIVERDGLEKAIETLIVENYGWSNLDARDGLGQPDFVLKLMAKDQDPRFKNVPGYGRAYQGEDGQSLEDSWQTSDDISSWCEYAYVVAPDAIRVYEHTNLWAQIATIAYDDPEAMLALQRRQEEFA